ncbi:MAG: hypothetical protein IPP94_03105 [Ignavibacteria bacterium]|nr:hypothetical protein [Ignavibacteria bacterium]
MKLWHAMADLQAEVDPAYARIRRAVMACLTGNGFACRKTIHGTVYQRAGTDGTSMLRPPVPEDEVLRFIARRGVGGDCIRMLVVAAFDCAEGSDSHRPGWTVRELCGYLVRYYAVEPTLGIDTGEDERVYPFEIETLLDIEMKGFRGEWKASRLLPDDAQYSEAHGYSAALREVLEDTVNDTLRPWFDYYHTQFPSISKCEYRRGPRIRFEKIMRERRENFLRHCWERMFAF